VSEVLAVVAEHGEILLFLYVLADQLGVPIPASPVLMAAGGLAATGRLSLPGAVGLGVLATLVADLVWYAIGRLRGARVLGLLCRVSLEPDSCVRRTEAAHASRRARGRHRDVPGTRLTGCARSRTETRSRSPLATCPA
jgi:membrane protein DedA with SNARE-associated domain